MYLDGRILYTRLISNKALGNSNLLKVSNLYISEIFPSAYPMQRGAFYPPIN